MNYVHDFSPVSALVIGAPRSERLLFGRETRNLRRCFKRFVGRNRKSRRREAAGRRNYPEAVPNEEGKMGKMNGKHNFIGLRGTGEHGSQGPVEEYRLIRLTLWSDVIR